MDAGTTQVVDHACCAARRSSSLTTQPHNCSSRRSAHRCRLHLRRGKELGQRDIARRWCSSRVSDFPRPICLTACTHFSSFASTTTHARSRTFSDAVSYCVHTHTTEARRAFATLDGSCCCHHGEVSGTIRAWLSHQKTKARSAVRWSTCDCTDVSGLARPVEVDRLPPRPRSYFELLEASAPACSQR